MPLERLRGRIQPIELMDEDKCYEILHFSKSYHGLNQDDKVKVLHQYLSPILEKGNEVVWKHYPIQKIDAIDDSKARIMAYAESIAHLPLYQDMQLVSSLLNDQMFIYKNYQEMVAYVTVVWYELDKFLLKVENERATMQDRVDDLTKKNDRLLEENTRLIRQKEYEPIKVPVQTQLKANVETDYDGEQPEPSEEKPEHTYSETEKISGNQNTTEEFSESKVIASEHVGIESTNRNENTAMPEERVEESENRIEESRNRVDTSRQVDTSDTSTDKISLTGSTTIDDKIGSKTNLSGTDKILADESKKNLPQQKKTLADKICSVSSLTKSEKITLLLFLENGILDRKTLVELASKRGIPKGAPHYHLIAFPSHGILIKRPKEDSPTEFEFELSPDWFDHVMDMANRKSQAKVRGVLAGWKGRVTGAVPTAA